MDIAIEPITGTDITRIRVSGRIDSYTVQRVEEEIQSLVRIGTSKLICDLCDVEFVAGPGLKVFLKAMQEARKQDGDLKLCGARPDVEKLFSLAGFTSIATLYPTETAALADFGIAPSTNQYGQIMVDASDDSGNMQTLVAGAGDAGYMETMVAGEDIGFDKTLMPGDDEDLGYMQTMVAGEDNVDTGFMQTLIGAPDQGFDQTFTGDAPAPTPDPQKARDTVMIDRKTCESIIQQIDDLEEEPAEESVNLADETLSTSTSPRVEPISMSLSCDETHLSNIYRLVNTLGTMAELDSKRALHYSEAVTEVLRAAMQDKMLKMPIRLVLQIGDKAMGATIRVPSTKFKLAEQLRPSTDRKVKTREAAAAWLKKAVGAIEERVESSNVVIVLKA